MKTMIVKGSIAFLLLLIFSAAAEVKGQTMNVTWTDNGTPAPSSTDFYEISWIVYRTNPFSTYTCTPSASTATWNATSQQEIFSCSVPDAGAVYRVEVAIKRRDGNNNVVSGGRNSTGLMTATQLAGTFSVHVDLN